MPKTEWTINQLVAIREEVLGVIDDGCPKHNNSPWMLYKSGMGVDEAFANAERLDFCDELQRRLMKRSE